VQCSLSAAAIFSSVSVDGTVASDVCLSLLKDEFAGVRVKGYASKNYNHNMIAILGSTFMLHEFYQHYKSLKIAVFWVVAPCSLVEVYQRFRGPCCLHHQGDE
jgi:hypothetical protein